MRQNMRPADLKNNKNFLIFNKCKEFISRCSVKIYAQFHPSSYVKMELKYEVKLIITINLKIMRRIKVLHI